MARGGLRGAKSCGSYGAGLACQLVRSRVACSGCLVVVAVASLCGVVALLGAAGGDVPWLDGPCGSIGAKAWFGVVLWGWSGLPFGAAT